MKYDLLIFVQAAADLRYALDIIEKNKLKKIHLYIIHVKAIYNFVKTLDLENVNIQYQDYFTFKLSEPKTYFKVKKGLLNFWKTAFSENTYNKVYFFSKFYDFHTASVIVKLNNPNTIYYDHYDTVSVINDIPVSNFSFLYLKNKYLSLIVSFISGANFISKYRRRYLEFDYQKYSIKKTLIEDKVFINSKYKYKTGEKSKKKQIVFLLSPDEIKMITKESLLKLKDILLDLKKDYDLYLKGHPRLGFPENLLEFFNGKIPNYIPTEFLTYSEFEYTMGIMSSGLVYPSQLNNNKVISCINLLDFVNDNDKHFFFNFLKEHSKNKVLFIKEITDLNKI